MKLNFTAPLALCAVVLLLTGCGSAESMPEFQMPPPQVDVVVLEPQTVNITHILPARAVASAVAKVRPQINGIVQKRLFVEGAFVEAGQPLYQIDDTIYQANLASAKAQLLRAQANLQSAKSEMTRYKKLLQDRATSEQKFEAVEANYLAVNAEIAVHQAAIGKAQADISYTRVLAPIAGQISKSFVTEGALVTAAQGQELAIITQLDPIYFDLVQASKQLRDTKARIASGEFSETEQQAALYFSRQERYKTPGRLKFHEVVTNPSTDTVTLRVEFDNQDKTLMPGMYGQVELTQALRQQSILVPQKAVSFNSKGQASVYVLTSGNKVITKMINIGRAFGQEWLVLDGLSAGDSVVISGLQKIRPGATVEVSQKAAP